MLVKQIWTGNAYRNFNYLIRIAGIRFTFITFFRDRSRFLYDNAIFKKSQFTLFRTFHKTHYLKQSGQFATFIVLACEQPFNHLSGSDGRRLINASV